MTIKSLFSALAIAVMTLSAATGADDDSQEKDGEKELTRSEKRLARIMERYQETGEVRHCVPLRYLRESTVIDDQTIFFRGLGRKAYMNKMSHKCPRLSFEERFMYSTSIAQLCKGEIITVLDSFGRQWGSCGLGEFREMERKPKAEADKE
jgi:hypothetical protein